VFHAGTITIASLKYWLRQQGIAVRP